MKVEIARPARNDLTAIGDEIAKDNPARAGSFVDELIDRCLSLSIHPERFPVALARPRRAIRKMTHGNYLIFYVVGADQIDILRVVHSARDWVALLHDTPT